MQERRKFVRLDLNVEVQWHKIAESSRAAADSVNVSKNISGGGICLMVNEPVVVGDTLKLDIALPENKSIRAIGRVAWVDTFEIIGGRREVKYEAGIEFVDISNVDREQIKKLVFSLLHEKK